MARSRRLKPSVYGGFILGFEPARTEIIEEYLSNDWPISESFSSEDWNLQKSEAVYLARRGPQPEIFALALMSKRGRGGGTKRTEMRSTELIVFKQPISCDEASNAEGLRRNISTADNVIRLPASIWQQLNRLVKQLRPDQASSIDELVQLRLVDGSREQVDNRNTVLAQERDALGLAFDVAGLDRKSLLKTADRARLKSASSVIDIIDGQRIAERSLVERDANALRISLASVSQNAHLRDDRGREIRVYVLDSTPLETATGVDLLLYQEQYGSMLLLQYKAMNKDEVVKGWSYRVDGTNLDSQLEKMSNLRNLLPPATPTLPKDQRLNDEPFYFKFCERQMPVPGDEGLTKGLTISAPHLAQFLTLPEAVEEGRGRRVGYDNCARYLTNTDFVSLARGGWIGCSERATAAIAEIMSARGKGRIAIIAVIKGLALKSENRGRP